MAPFFFFGLWLRENQQMAGWWGGLILVAGLVLWGLTFDRPTGVTLALVYLAMNFAGILLVPMVERTLWRSPFLEVLGTDSLFFYLFHPLVFLAFEKTFYLHTPWLGAWIATLVATLALLFATRTTLRYSSLARRLTGLVSPSARPAPAPA